MTNRRQTWLDHFLKTRPHLREHIDLLIYPPSMDEVVAEFPEALAEPDLERGVTRLMRDTHDGRGHGLTVLAFYLITRRNGTDHDFAMMLATQRAPGVETTDTFWAGRKRFDQVYGEQYANTVRAKLKAQGVNLGNKEYFPELARFQGDPEAVLSFNNIRGEIKALQARRGAGVSGAVTLKPREPEKDQLADENCPRLAPDLAIREANRMCRENPDLRRKTKRELVEMAIERHGASR